MAESESEKLYMQSPLVLWVETFKANDGHPLEYQDLYDGVFLNDVMQQIDPRPNYDNVNRSVDDVSVRLVNWDVLVKNIRGYYMDVLQQLLVMRLPNTSAICKDPGKDSSFAEIRKALLLILGCAVQCENKETYIDKIMAMDIRAQTEIVDNIKEITDDCESILPTQRPESQEGCKSYMDKMFHHLHRLIKERDDCAELVSDLGQERDFYMSQAEGKAVVDTPQMSPQKHHIALELAECKAKVRHLRQEVEDYHEQLTDVKEELKKSSMTCSHLKSENANLLQEARATRSLRDELDIMKEKAAKVDMFEKEILKYKERLNELEFFKARTEELKEDNTILEETKAMLEDQLTNSRKRIETVVELEAELGRYRLQVEENTRDRENDREKIEYLTGENARLEFEKKSSMNESASLESELMAAKSRIGSIGGSLSEQLSETSHARILRLELENQRLAAKLAEMKETALIQNAEISLELEKENQRLVKRMEKLQTTACESSEQVVHIESELSSVKEEKDRLMKALDAVKENSDRQVRELERENEQLAQTLDSIRERSEKTSDAKVKDLERENKRLHETVVSKNSSLSKYEFDNRQLQRTVQQLEENVERIQSLEQDCQQLEKENSELHQKVGTLQLTSEKLESIEHENSDLNVENRKLKKTVESLQSASQRRDHLEQDHISLKVDHQRLQKTLESLKVESERMIELETEKDELRKEINQLQKSLEGQKTQKLKQEQMEFEVIDLGNENQRLQKSLEVTSRRLQQLEKDNSDLETEGDRLIKEVESLRLTSKRLEDKEKESAQLDSELQRIQMDKTSLEKENRKLKQSAELKDTSLDELNAKFATLDQESKSLRQCVEKMKDTCSKVKDLEKENKELLQDLNTDRRTLATLREELVSEKIKSQELSNQLEQLTGELERVGIDTEKLKMAEQINEENRYKALETMIEETLKKSTELKEEKIQALEMRLEESKKRNTRLQEELRTAKRESEVMKARFEEEQEEMVKTTNQEVQHRREFERDRPILTGNASHVSKEILELKDRRIELERMNATLLAENKNLKGSNSQLLKQCKDIETNLVSLQSQNSSLQNSNSSLHERIANLQVENTTLKSQCSSTLQQQDMLKEHISKLEVENESLLHNHDKLKNTHNSLISDHESLQRLHEQLTLDYEKLLKEYNSHKSLQKSLKTEVISLQEQLNALLQGKDDVNKLRDALEGERDRLKRELQSLGNLQSDYKRLSEDHQQMTLAYDKLSKDYSDVLSSHKQVKTDFNNLQRKATEQHGEITEAKENLSVADVEFQKLENKMEAIYQVNERLENENQALLLQIQQLLNQNQDLLTQALNSKDHFAEEEKAYLEKLSELRRQKERLEEKIMEHYKNRISPKKKGLGALIARKARGIISRAPRRSKSRNNLNEVNDNSSQGSGSNEHVSDTSRKLEKNSVRRKSSGGAEEFEDGPKLASQNRLLAKSYTALPSPVFENDLSPLRGAKSSEDLNEGSSDGGLLPGLGRPYNMDDSDSPPGQRPVTPASGGRKNPGRSSPGSEMLTLDQFLKEANKSTPASNSSSRIEDEAVTNEHPEKRHHQHHNTDNDSRSSENSNNSNSRFHHLPPHGSSDRSHRSSLYRPNVPDVAAPSLMSTSTRDINASRLSHGSGHDNSSFDSSGAVAGDILTSTPKAEPDSILHSSFDPGSSHAPRFPGEERSILGEGVGSRYMSQKRLSGEDWRSSSQESSPYASSNRVNSFSNHPPSSSSPRNPGSLASSSSSLNQSQNPPIVSSSAAQSLHHHPSSQSAFNVNANNNSRNSRDRDLPPPPIPTEPPPSLPATERLDRLTHQYSTLDQGMAFYAQPTNLSSHSSGDRSGQWTSPNRKNSVNRDNEPTPYKSSEIERRKSQGHIEGAKGLPSQFQPPIPRSHPGAPSDKRLMLSSSQSFDSSVVSGHNPRRPPANANLFQNNPHQRARPSSVMGHSGQVRGVYSRPPGEGRPQSQHHAPLRKDPSDTSQNNRLISERPKSVPPQLFNPVENNSNNSNNRRDIPVPPPRRTRVDGRDGHPGRDAPDGKDPRDAESQLPPSSSTSNISLIREPSRRGSRQFGQAQEMHSRPPSSGPPSSGHELRQSNPQSQESYPNYSQSSGAFPPAGGRPSGNMPSNHPHQEHSSNARNPNVPTSTRPDTIGQHSQNRPDSLPLGGPGSHQGHGPSSTLPPRAQSSMGNPVSSVHNQHPQQMYGRSSTPGPQFNRRDPSSGQTQRNSDAGLAPSSYRGRDAGGEQADYQYQGHHPDSRQKRAGSDPREMGYAPASREAADFGPGNDNQNAIYHQQRTSQTLPPSNSRPLPRGHSQGPPQSRPPAGFHNDQRSSNGPLSPHGSQQTSHFTNSHPSQHSHNNSGLGPPPVQPQIRSQGKSPTTNLPPSSGPQLRSSREAFSPQDRAPPGLSSALPNAASLPNQQKAPPANAPRQEGEGEGQPPKHANSIWYEYGCV